MTFTGVKNRTSERFNEVYVLHNYISLLEPREPTIPVPYELKIMKGLFCVHLYAAFEKTISDIIETTLLLISSKSIKNNHFSPALLSIVLWDRMKSLKDSRHSKLLVKSSEIFSESNSANVVQINETIFSNCLQNAWAKTIIEISAILGMNDYDFDPRTKTTIDEIVDKRNAVAHGRDRASVIGERYRADVLRDKMDIVSAAAQNYISAVEQHCEEKKYIKPVMRRRYS